MFAQSNFSSYKNIFPKPNHHLLSRRITRKKNDVCFKNRSKKSYPLPLVAQKKIITKQHLEKSHISKTHSKKTQLNENSYAKK